MRKKVLGHGSIVLMAILLDACRGKMDIHRRVLENPKSPARTFAPDLAFIEPPPPLILSGMDFPGPVILQVSESRPPDEIRVSLSLAEDDTCRAPIPGGLEGSSEAVSSTNRVVFSKLRITIPGHYRLQAKARGGNAVCSGKFTVERNLAEMAVANFTASLSADGSVALRADVMEGALTYELYRVEGSEPDAPLASMTLMASSPSPTFEDVGVKSHKAYVYRMLARNQLSSSAPSPAVKAVIANRPPIITTTSPQSVFDSHTLAFTLTAEDADGDAVSFACDSQCPSTLSVTSGGKVSWKPRPKDIGSHDVVFRASDAFGGASLKSIRIDVKNQFVTNMDAFMVWGQDDFTHGDPNRGSATPTAQGVKYPWSAIVADGKLLISDYDNSRILGFTFVPTSPSAMPDFVLGQGDFTSNATLSSSGGCPASSLNDTGSLAFTGGMLLLGQQGGGYSRVLGWNGVPSTDNAPGTFVLGHQSITTCATEPTADNTIRANYALGLSATPNSILVGDRGNHRLLRFKAPFTSGQSADLILGQSSSTGSAPGAGLTGLNSPRGAWTDDANYLIVADAGNHRVLIYSPIPTTHGAPANVILGQDTPTGVLANRGGTPSCATLNSPVDVTFDGYRLYVTDFGNSRILIYNGMPTQTGAAADIVIGQPNCTSVSPNQGGAIGPNTLTGGTPFYDGTSIVVTDWDNHRVLWFGAGFDTP